MAQTQKTRNANGAGSIYKRSDGRYCGQIQIGTKSNGKPNVKYVYGKTPKEAQQKLDNLKLLYSTSEELNNNIVIEKTYEDMYIDEYFLRWLRNDKINSLKESSYDTLESTVLNHIIPAIGQFKMNGEVSSEILKELLINKPYKKGLSYSVVKKIYTATNECFNHAKLLEHIEKNPMERVKMLPSEKFESEDNDIKFFTDDEIVRLKEAINIKNGKGEYIYQMGYIFIFLLNTGLRIGELLSLKWKNIDFDNRIIYIKSNLSEVLERNKNGERIKNENGTLKKKTITGKTKTKSSTRSVPLNDNAIEALNVIKSIRYFGESSYILSTQNKKPFIRKNCYDMFNRILNKANINQCGLHALRHTFASKLFKEGVDIAVVSKLLGHKNIGITYNIYIHIIEEQKTKAINLINI